MALTQRVPVARARAADAALLAWFAAQGWSPAPFQRQVWRHWQRGESGLLVTPTGSGKTLAALGGALLDGLREAAPASPTSRLRLLWVTPLRALRHRHHPGPERATGSPGPALDGAPSARATPARATGAWPARAWPRCW
ncbi:DEAD/DEAH box helicase [Hydrogenophaga sp. UC242_50]|uniref:DEAD/DEAH box helicase n=1 Tax=Hydrogenophaga sp. UC242_50 TaxID=3350169 RepID=UPI0036D2BBA9